MDLQLIKLVLHGLIGGPAISSKGRQNKGRSEQLRRIVIHPLFGVVGTDELMHRNLCICSVLDHHVLGPIKDEGDITFRRCDRHRLLISCVGDALGCNHLHEEDAPFTIDI